MVSGRVVLHSCTFSTTSQARPAASAVGGELRLTDCTVDGSGGAGTVGLRMLLARALGGSKPLTN